MEALEGRRSDRGTPGHDRPGKNRRTPGLVPFAMSLDDPDRRRKPILHRHAARNVRLRERADHLAEEVAVVYGAVAAVRGLDVRWHCHARGIEKRIRMSERGSRAQMEQGKARGGTATQRQFVHLANELSRLVRSRIATVPWNKSTVHSIVKCEYTLKSNGPRGT